MNGYPTRTQFHDVRLEERIDRLSLEVETIPLGTIGSSTVRTEVGLYSFPSSYTTGGVSLPLLGVVAPTAVQMLPWASGGGTVYLFAWDDGAQKMIVTDWTGTEIANGTDLSAILDHPYTVYSAASVSVPSPRLAQAGRVVRAEIEVSVAVPASASNYWTITLRHLQTDPLSPQTAGMTLGSYATQVRGIAANTPVALYDDPQGFDVEEDDRFPLTVSAVGNPIPLENLVLRVSRYRKVR